MSIQGLSDHGPVLRYRSQVGKPLFFLGRTYAPWMDQGMAQGIRQPDMEHATDLLEGVEVALV